MELLVILVGVMGVMGFFLIRRLSRKRARDKTIEGDSPLHEAAREGRTETVDAFLADGADPNAKDSSGDTPLHKAAREGYTETVDALLKADGANPNAQNEFGSHPPAPGRPERPH